MTTRKIINLSEYRKLKWFFDSLSWRVVYYTDTLEFFDFVEDAKRFADGSNFVCKKCGHTAGYVRMDGAELHKVFIVVHVICANCGNRWRKTNIEPLYERIFLDWQSTASET